VEEGELVEVEEGEVKSEDEKKPSAIAAAAKLLKQVIGYYVLKAFLRVSYPTYCIIQGRIYEGVLALPVFVKKIGHFASIFTKIKGFFE